MPRFAILYHVAPPGYREGSHWDLLLEDGNRLLAWALAKPPAPGETISATQLPDHRLIYLKYEGLLSGERGHVERVEGGDFYWIERSDDRRGAELHGQRATIFVELRRQAGTQWIAVFDSARRQPLDETQ